MEEERYVLRPKTSTYSIASIKLETYEGNMANHCFPCDVIEQCCSAHQFPPLSQIPLLFTSPDALWLVCDRVPSLVVSRI